MTTYFGAQGIALGGYYADDGDAQMDHSNLYIDGNTINSSGHGVTFWGSGGTNKVMTCNNTVNVPDGDAQVAVWWGTYDGPFALDIDTDGDGIIDCDDKCPGTISDEPSKRLGTNRWIWNGTDWETNSPRGKGPGKDFSMEDTLGCSCEQILAILEEKTGSEFNGHYKFGCASSILEDWISGMYYLETVEVPAASPGVESQTELIDGVDYLLKATGVAYAGDTIDFDAKYSITNRIAGDTWTDTVSGYESYGSALLDLFVNGSSVDWGAYNDAHEYWYELAGDGNPVSFYVYDIYPINNTGSLSVDINVKLW